MGPRGHWGSPALGSRARARWLTLPAPPHFFLLWKRTGPGLLRPAAGPAAHPALPHAPARLAPRHPTPAGLSLEIALTSLPCPPFPVGPGAPSLHPQLPCPVRNRRARFSHEAASSGNRSHLVAQRARTEAGGGREGRLISGRGHVHVFVGLQLRPTLRGGGQALRPSRQLRGVAHSQQPSPGARSPV